MNQNIAPTQNNRSRHRNDGLTESVAGSTSDNILKNLRDLEHVTVKMFSEMQHKNRVLEKNLTDIQEIENRIR